MILETVVIIPARYGSRRFPGKPLVPIAQKPLIQWVFERATRIRGVHSIIVATDHPDIQEAVQQVGGMALMTPDHLRNGSERVAWVARQLDAEIVINLQGDEPLVDTDAIARAVEWLRFHPEESLATLACPLRHEAEWKDPNVVKVLTDERDNAVYFSRSPVPFFREGGFRPLECLKRHIGVYVFRRTLLLAYAQWPPGKLEEIEKLEQLRIVERGVPIKVIPAAYCSPGIDTPEDVMTVEKILKAEGIAE